MHYIKHFHNKIKEIINMEYIYLLFAILLYFPLILADKLGSEGTDKELQKQYAEENGLPYYDNDLVIAKQDGTPILADWISVRFPDLIKQLDLPELRFHDLRHTAAANMYNLTGDFFTVGEILGHTRIGDSLGVATSQEMVTARYVEVRLGRKKIERY